VKRFKKFTGTTPLRYRREQHEAQGRDRFARSSGMTISFGNIEPSCGGNGDPPLWCPEKIPPPVMHGGPGGLEVALPCLPRPKKRRARKAEPETAASAAPEAHGEHKLVQVRREKLEKLQDLGIDPYGAKFATTHRPAALREDFAENLQVSVAGRIVAWRDMGTASSSRSRMSMGRSNVPQPEERGR